MYMRVFMLSPGCTFRLDMAHSDVSHFSLNSQLRNTDHQVKPRLLQAPP